MKNNTKALFADDYTYLIILGEFIARRASSEGLTTKNGFI